MMFVASAAFLTGSRCRTSGADNTSMSARDARSQTTLPEPFNHTGLKLV